ncbi:MAG: hypothetical protein ABJE95_13160 [Byssovorax sp.]
MSSPAESPQTTPSPDAGPAGEAEAKPPRAPTGPIQRGAPLRRALLGKLTRLAVTADSAGAMKVDPGAADLDADAFIAPLHALVAEGPR